MSQPPPRDPSAPASAPAPPANPRFYADDDIHLLDRLAVVYRYKTVAVSVFVLTTLAVMIQGYTTIQLYQAQAQVLIDEERAAAVPGLTSTEAAYYQDPEPYYNTQFRILKGRDLARRVIRQLKLDTVPEFNGSAPKPSTPAVLVDRAKGWIAETIGLRPAAVAIAEPPKIDETSDESALVSDFLDRLDVIPVKGSRLVDVAFRSIDPKFAALAVNTVVDNYVEQNLAVKLESTQNTIEWLDKELAKQQQKVEDSERALANYRERQNAMSLDDKQNIVVSRLNKLNDDLLMAKSRLAQKNALYSSIRTIGPGQPADSNPVIAQNPSVAAAKSKVSSLQSERARIAERYGEKHPQMQKANADLGEAQRQYELEVGRAAQAIKNDYETAALEEQTMARALEGAKADAQDLSKKSIDYNVMEREAKSNRQVYETLLQRGNELRVSSNNRANNVRVIDHAEVPKAPMTPAGRRTWLVAITIGLVLTFAVVYGLDYMNDTIKTPEDITRRLKMTMIGLVPSVPSDRQPVLASSHVPYDFGEAFRSLRTSLVTKFPGSGNKTLLVTSAQPLEGKTTTAVNIALALAYSSARVLLIDADMRRPGMHRPLRLANERGLSQVLMGQARVRDVIQRTVDPNLLAITAGGTPPNPSELLASERMKTLLTNLAHGPFDWIIIDTPPILAVTDAVILAPVVQGVTMVIGSEMTRRRLVERALETMMAANPKQINIILNKVDFARNKYYYSRYYGHQYKSYYSQAPV